MAQPNPMRLSQNHLYNDNFRGDRSTNDEEKSKRFLCIPFCGKFLNGSYANSNFYRYLEGNSIESDEVDSLINLVGVIAGLMTTISPGLLSFTLTNSWVTLQTNIQFCAIEGTSDLWKQAYQSITSLLWVSNLFGGMTLLGVMLYYVCRNKRNMARWWKSGGCSAVVTLLFFLSVATIAQIFAFIYIQVWFSPSQDDLCVTVSRVQNYKGLMTDNFHSILYGITFGVSGVMFFYYVYSIF